MTSKVCSVFLVLGWLSYNGCAADLDLTSYPTMPLLHAMDFYDSCLQSFPKAQYCVVDITLGPADEVNPSRSWDYTNNFSKNIRHYRHDQPLRGICLHWCEIPHYIPGRNMEPEFFLHEERTGAGRVPVPEQHLEKYIEKCINKEFLQYEMVAKNLSYTCETAGDKIPIDWLDWTVALASLFVIMLLLTASSYDYYLRSLTPGITFNNHYKAPVTNSFGKWLVCFSVCRNWARLVEDTAPEDKDLQCIQGLRFLTMTAITLAHVIELNVVLPIANPEIIEQSYTDSSRRIMVNGDKIVQIFFAVTGFLLSHRFFELNQLKTFNVTLYFTNFVYRYIRLAPPLLAVILASSTWAIRMGDGPRWNDNMLKERNNCRQNGWANMLFIQNHYEPDHSCTLQTWYLAADMQLYVVAMLVLMLCWRFRKATKWIIGAATAVTFIIPGVITYIYKDPAITMQTPENLRDLSHIDPVYRRSFLPAYQNAASYFTGIVFALVYRYVRKNKIDLKQSKIFVFFYWIMGPLFILFVLSGMYFHSDYYVYNRIEAAVYSSINKGLYGFAVCYFVLGSALGVGGIYRDLFLWSPFVVLGRLTYAAYLVHMMILRICHAGTREVGFLTPTSYLENNASNLVFSYTAALVISLMVELPTTALRQLIMSQRSSKGYNYGEYLKYDRSSTKSDQSSEEALATLQTGKNEISRIEIPFIK